tara:strand:- start:11232 stop:11849 length:618 start_codon:yes stop_codon:yes gene_type:complete
MTKKSPFLVGITGGVGAGKSLICKILNTLGVPIYLSDGRAKVLMNNNEDLKKEIINNFGIESYKNNKIDNQFLSNKIFENNSHRLKINSLVHPFVKEDFHFWIKKNSNNDYLVKESALIIESESYKELDFLIYVSAERNIRIKRVLQRDQEKNEDDIVKIIKTQMDVKKAINFCDEVIDNNEKNLLLPKVLKIHKKILKKSNNFK